MLGSTWDDVGLLFVYKKDSSMSPIYEQIVDQIKAYIRQGRLQQEQSLPSIRGLAKDLRISALTVKRPMIRWRWRALS